ncbi:hypothetical protein DVH05_005062 [Phytophthora capsici]|nr:hypothetical protein DVH05_005062 [Phytophthora capsici]
MLIVRAPSAAVNTAIAVLARHGATRIPTRATTEGNVRQVPLSAQSWHPPGVVVVRAMVVPTAPVPSAAVGMATVVWARRGVIPTRIRPTTVGNALQFY